MTEETKVESTEETTPTVVEPSQEDPVQVELARVEKPKRSKLETLTYNRDRLTKEIEEEKAKNGIVEDEDDRPLTMGDLKRIKAEEGLNGATQLADAIADEHERKLVKHYLENSIKPSGDPQEDFRLAQAMVNAVKNRQVAEEAARTVIPRSVATGTSAPAKEKSLPEELSKEDAAIAQGFGLTPEEIAKATQ